MDRNDHEVIIQEQDHQERLNLEREEFLLAYKRASPGPRARRGEENSYESIMGWTTIDQKDAKKFCPPDAYIWKTNLKRGWAGEVRPYAAISETTAHQTPLEAMLVLLRRLWKRHNKKNRVFPLEQSPVPGLFPPLPQAAPASGASASSKSKKS